MPYSRIYLSRKNRKNLERLAKEFELTPRDLLKEMIEQYYNLMTLFEVEVGDSHSRRKYAQSQKARLGMFPVVRLPETIKEDLDKELAIHQHSKFRYLTRIVDMGQEELEYDLSEGIARVIVVKKSKEDPADLTLEEMLARRAYQADKSKGKH
jgi:predicted DNA-binding protein